MNNSSQVTGILAPGMAICSGSNAGLPPREVQVVPLGRFIYTNPKLTNGKPVEWDITAEDVRSMVATKDQVDVVVDYEHQTLDGCIAPAAGWITELVDQGARGLVARVKWTEKAAKMIADGAYRYLSPVILRDMTSKTEPGKKLRMYLHSVALTNRPFLPSIEPLVAKGLPFDLCIARHVILPCSEECLTEGELAICKAMGVDSADYAKTKAASPMEYAAPAESYKPEIALLFGNTEEDLQKYGRG